MIVITCIFLAFSHFNIIIPLLILGLMGIDRNIFYLALCLICFSIIVNVALKVTFQIPLLPPLNPHWFAFPSGHMQLTTVFYGWIAYQINNKWLRLFVIILLTGIGASLIYAGYHTIYDVVAGLVVGLILIIAYQALSKRYSQKHSFILLIISLVLISYIRIRYYQIPLHALIAFITLAGLTIFIRGNRFS